MNLVRRMRLARAGEVPAGVADREADGLGADVEPDELAAIGQSGSEFRGKDVISAAMRQASAPRRAGSRPRTGHNHRRDNCCRAGRTAQAAGWRRRAISSPSSQRPPTGRPEASRTSRSAVGTSVPGLLRGRRGAILYAGDRVDAQHVLCRRSPPVRPRDFSHWSRIGRDWRARRSSSRTGCSRSGGRSTGREAERRQVCARADRPADDIGRDHSLRDRLARDFLLQQPFEVERALAVTGEDDRRVAGASARKWSNAAATSR